LGLHRSGSVCDLRNGRLRRIGEGQRHGRLKARRRASSQRCDQRFARLTNAFSKKIDNHCAALALYFFHYNFCRQHKALRMSPAQAANLTSELPSAEHLCALMDAANPAKKRGEYKKQAA
jgi:hypothetical protein